MRYACDQFDTSRFQSWLHPVFDRLRQELFERDTIAAYQGRALRLDSLREGTQAREGIRRAPALHFDRDDDAAGTSDEVHLAVAFAPIEQLTEALGRRVGEMRAHRGLDEASAKLS